MSKNDIAWAKLFEKHHILDKIDKHGRATISSAEINEFREARLMTKFDHKIQLPKLFSDRHLSILPTSRGSYEIGTFNVFCDLPENDSEIIPIDFPTFLESIDYKDITGESAAISCAYLSNILKDFTGEENLVPTVFGRMSSSVFDFSIDSGNTTSRIRVNNAQVEIDGGYEGDESLCLIEAKNYISDDFLIRQLYYPFRLWSSKIHKRVRPLFLTYSNGIFRLREYEFTTPDFYNSIRLVGYRKYAVQDEAVNLQTIIDILESSESVRNSDTPFPQADKFERVINLCELIKQKGSLPKEDIAHNYSFTSRQSDYYVNAAKFLGLVRKIRENNKAVYSLSPEGIRIFDLPIFNRQIEFAKLILKHSVFRTTLRFYLDKGDVPEIAEVYDIMDNDSSSNIVSCSTRERRAQTVRSWVNWILSLVE